MKNRGLKSSYTVAYFKVHHSTCNEAKTTNVLNRKFLRDNPLEAIVTDLTYVRVGKNGICLFHFGSVQSRNSRLFLWRT